MFTSICTVILGFWGLCLLCVKHRGCAVTFGCFLFPATMSSLIFGSTLAFFSNSSMSVIEQYCEDRYIDNEAASNSREVVSTIDDVIGNLITEKMCSDVCPCPDEPFKSIWLDMEESTLNTFGRTKKNISQDLVPLDFTGKG